MFTDVRWVGFHPVQTLAFSATTPETNIKMFYNLVLQKRKEKSVFVLRIKIKIKTKGEQ
jgi:superfamily II DNA/RNA helicase